MKRIKFPELDGLKVTVDSVSYQPHAQTPEDRPHCFVYVISIWNHTPHPITIAARKWVVREETGELEILEGKGVVGMTPKIEPGDKFTYNSFHLLRSLSGKAEGSYVGCVYIKGEDVKWVSVRIPEFTMEVPGSWQYC